MSSTPILTKQQQRHSLSAKKALTKGLRNVLAQPQDNYWPLISADKCKVLEELLSKLMPAIKRPSYSIPWSQLRHMKKEERAQAKKEAISKEGNAPNTNIANSVILGINAVTRSLEKDNVCSVLIDANIEPQLLIKHVIHMAQNKKVPLLLVPELKKITLNSIGFPSAACALKNIVKESIDHHFYSLYLTIHDIFKNIPTPNKILQLFKNVDTSEESDLWEADKMSTETESQVESSKSIKFTLSTNVYMYRSSRKERAFVPPSGVDSAPSEPVIGKIDHDDFISISNYDSDECDADVKQNTRYMNIEKHKNSEKQKDHSNVNNKSANVTYLPLKVKRLQGNPNRIKATKVPKQRKK